MNPIDEQHRALVLSLVKSGDDILHEMNNGQAHLLHMAVGVPDRRHLRLDGGDRQDQRRELSYAARATGQIERLVRRGRCV